MTDAATPGLDMRSKMTVSDLRDPKMIINLPKEEHQMECGSIFGRITKIIERESPDKSQKFIGFGGMFEGHPKVYADDKNPRKPMASGVLFAPPAIHEFLFDAAKDLARGEHIDFAFDVFVERAGNPQGYSWMIRPLMEMKKPDATDPLAALRAMVKAPLALAAPTGTLEAGPVVEAAAEKAAKVK